MANTRRTVLALVGSISIGTFASWSTVAQTKIQIPIDPPVARPLSADMAQIETSIMQVISGLSEDQPRTMSEIMASARSLQNVPHDKMELAIVDLLWNNKIEEVDEGKFRLHRSHGG